MLLCDESIGYSNQISLSNMDILFDTKEEIGDEVYIDVKSKALSENFKNIIDTIEYTIRNDDNVFPPYNDNTSKMFEYFQIVFDDNFKDFRLEIIIGYNEGIHIYFYDDVPSFKLILNENEIEYIKKNMEG